MNYGLAQIRVTRHCCYPLICADPLFICGICVQAVGRKQLQTNSNESCTLLIDPMARSFACFAIARLSHFPEFPEEPIFDAEPQRTGSRGEQRILLLRVTDT